MGACASIFGFDELTDRVDDAGAVADVGSPRTDGGPDDAGIIIPRTCEGAYAPPETRKPAGGDRYDFALSDMALTGQERGFDLDCVDTDTLESSSCRLEDAATLAQVGDLAGLDNAANKFMGQAMSFLGGGGGDQSVVTRIQRGWSSVLFSMSSVVSLDDDDDVLVYAFPASRLAPACERFDGGTDADGGAVPRAPAFADEWCLDERFRHPQLGSTLPASHAYIRAGHLVARFDRLVIPLADTEGRLAYIDLSDALLMARITPTASGYALTEGNLGGRWTTKAFVDVFREAEKNDSCKNNSQFENSFVRYFCPHRDIRAADPPGTGCDAVSIGFGFEAYGVKTVMSDDVVWHRPFLVTEKCADAGSDAAAEDAGTGDCPSLD